MNSGDHQQTPGDPIRVMIVEDDRPTREGLGLLIDGTRGYRCVAKFRSVEEALKLHLAETPNVLLLDIRLPGMPGSDGVSVLKEKYPSAQILMLTINADEDSVFESICRGACGYLLKNTTPARLLEAISETHHGGAPMSPEVARKVVTLFQKTGPPQKIDERLTPQEMRLLRLLVEGHTYQGAADLLKISVHTARNYIRSIYEKLHVHSKSEAVGKALRSRIIY
ncbi:MAG TPA: response regulator transcription factor [Pyrinomonadaceae bacterium]|nr:response regulator transcription factor [Pyrinomonadaceae bacterium]